MIRRFWTPGTEAGKLLEQIIQMKIQGTMHLVSMDPDDPDERETIMEEDPWMQQDYTRRTRYGYRFLYDLNDQHLYVWLSPVSGHEDFAYLVSARLMGECFWGYLDDDFNGFGPGYASMYVPIAQVQTEKFKQGFQEFRNVFEHNQNLKAVMVLSTKGQDSCCYGRCFELEGWDWQEDLPAAAVKREPPQFQVGDRVRLIPGAVQRYQPRMSWLNQSDDRGLREIERARKTGEVQKRSRDGEQILVRFQDQPRDYVVSPWALERLPWYHSSQLTPGTPALKGSRRQYREGD